jgi:ATP-dependent RNA helicase DDX56/DBP9
MRLNLVGGKTLIFVNDVDRCYRLKLFLDMFSIRSAVLNSELPYVSRLHILSEFNKGMFDHLIATDESIVSLGTDSDAPPLDEDEDQEEQSAKKSKKAEKSEYGVMRGVDFREVETVINFDIPSSVRSYVHRIGRTARAGASGTSLSLFTEETKYMLERIQKKQAVKQIAAIQPLPFNMSELDGFRYRVIDGLRAVTKVAVKEARLKELRLELLKSEKLQSHFEDNPKDHEALRHDEVLHPARVQRHLKAIPTYLVPKMLSENMHQAADEAKARRAKRRVEKAPAKRRGRNQDSDPLKTFESGGAGDSGMVPAKMSGVWGGNESGRQVPRGGAKKQWQQKHGIGKKSKAIAKRKGGGR